MINVDTVPDPATVAEDAAVEEIVGAGASGAKMVAGIATAGVVLLWLAFYLLVFMPRSVSP
jgi:hypothetical protein